VACPGLALPSSQYTRAGVGGLRPFGWTALAIKPRETGVRYVGDWEGDNRVRRLGLRRKCNMLRSHYHPRQKDRFHLSQDHVEYLCRVGVDRDPGIPLSRSTVACL